MNHLEDFDKYQGEDPGRLILRDKMPEPSRVEYPIIKVLKPYKIPFLNSEAFETTPTIETELFEKVWMVTADGARFHAWKSSCDGKIYI